LVMFLTLAIIDLEFAVPSLGFPAFFIDHGRFPTPFYFSYYFCYEPHWLIFMASVVGVYCC
jgi:hypothetical protein